MSRPVYTRRKPLVTENETPSAVQDPDPARRLIIVVVEAGEDPVIETDPPESFAFYEIEAALKRALQILQEDEILSELSDSEEGEDD